jgi:hypothetical protein
VSGPADVRPTAGRPLLQALQRTGYRLAQGSGLTSLVRTLHRRRVPILCYHSVVDRELPPWVSESGSHLPAKQFESQIRFLAAHYRVIPLGDLIQVLAEGGSLPERAAVITFDDGHINNLRIAGPILAAHGCPATVFLATGYLDSGDLYWGDELHLILSRGLGRQVDAAGCRLDLQSEAGVRAARALLRVRLEAATLAEPPLHTRGSDTGRD